MKNPNPDPKISAIAKRAIVTIDEKHVLMKVFELTPAQARQVIQNIREIKSNE
jgi:hypothetical protein